MQGRARGTSPNRPRRTDVAIVGAGPAGLSTALNLLQLDPGWAGRMLVLEKAAHPRAKLCGGGITRFGLRHLRSLGLQLDVEFSLVENSRLIYQDCAIDVRGRPTFIVTHRPDFDAWLARQARGRGVHLLENTRVIALKRGADAMLLETEGGQVLASVVVGADGSRGLIRSWLGGRETPSHVARLLEVVSLASTQDREFTQRQARFDFTPSAHGLQGYHWDFPSLIGGRPHINSGVFDARVAPRARRADLMAEMRKGKSPAEVAQGEIRGHPIHWFSPRNTFAIENVLLVGDAAGTDPLFGEGISFALGYGRIAARCIDAAFKRGEVNLGDYRRRLFLSDVGRALLLRWLAARAVYPFSHRQTFMRALWHVGRLMAALMGTGSWHAEVYRNEGNLAKR
jgi:flavin-dependent dehydrogenase